MNKKKLALSLLMPTLFFVSTISKAFTQKNTSTNSTQIQTKTQQIINNIKSQLTPSLEGKSWGLNKADSLTIIAGPGNKLNALSLDETDLKQHSIDFRNSLISSIKNAHKIIDITNFGEIQSEFSDPISQALKQISARNVSVRVFTGLSPKKPGWLPAWLTKAEDYSNTIQYTSYKADLKNNLLQLTKGLTDTSNVTIYFSGGYRVKNPGLFFSNHALSWNHSKIVAIDGKESIVGGINMLNEYLGKTPVFDISMKVFGDPAISAHNFVDSLWDNASNSGKFIYYQWKNGIITELTDFTQVPRVTENYNFTTNPNSPITILGLGQGDNQNDSQLDIAVKALLQSAKKDIYISQQSLAAIPPLNQFTGRFSFSAYDQELLTLLANKAINNVKVQITLSNINSVHETGSSVTNEAVLENIWSNLPPVSKNSSTMDLLCQNLKVAYLRVNHSDNTYPTTPDKSFANHAKSIMVDHKAFLIGSHNLYAQFPAKLSEFAYLVEDNIEANKFYNQYWKPVWSYSSRTAISKQSCINTLIKV